MVILELAIPKRTVIHNKEQFNKFLKKYHGRTNIYKSVYKFKYPATVYAAEYETAILNTMFFDCDSKDSINVINKFHNYLVEKNLRHHIIQSSFKRFHLFVAVKPNNIYTNKKVALFNAMVHLAKEAEISYGYGDVENIDLDASSFGDLARLCALVKTYKPKKKSWVNYVKIDDVNDEERLKKISSRLYKTKPTYYGTKLFDITKFDDGQPTENMVRPNRDWSECNLEVTNEEATKLAQAFPPIIKKILSNYKPEGSIKGYCDDHNMRWLVAIVCRDAFEFDPKVTEQICKHYFSQHKNYSTCNGSCTQWDRFEVCHGVDSVYTGHHAHRTISLHTLEKRGYEVTKEDREFWSEIY